MLTLNQFMHMPRLPWLRRPTQSNIVTRFEPQVAEILCPPKNLPSVARWNPAADEQLSNRQDMALGVVLSN